MLLDPMNQERMKKTTRISFFPEGSEPFCQHITSDCLMNQGMRKRKKHIMATSVLSLLFEFTKNSIRMPKSHMCGSQ